MKLPLTYNIRSVLVRWRSTLATVLCTALVVAVYVVIQSLAVGLEKSSGNTGDPRNLLVIRRGATAESTSQITPSNTASSAISRASNATRPACRWHPAISALLSTCRGQAAARRTRLSAACRRSERNCARKSASQRVAGSRPESARLSSVNAWPPASPECRSESPSRRDPSTLDRRRPF